MSKPILAQQKVFYTGEGDWLLTQTHVDSAVAHVQQKYQAQGFRAALVIKSKTQRPGTPFYTYGISSGPAPLLKAQEELAHFVGQPLPAFTL